MTYDEIAIIAKRLDKNVKKQIDLDVEERMEILKQGNLTEKELERMEENLYMSLVLQEYLSGEYELLEEEKALLLAEMEDLYNEYVDLLAKAKLEKKINKKKMMALELMKIREQLLRHKKTIARVKADLKQTKKNIKNLEEKSSKKKMKEVAAGMDYDLGQGISKISKPENRNSEYTDTDIRRIAREEARNEYLERNRNKERDVEALTNTNEEYGMGIDTIGNSIGNGIVYNATYKASTEQGRQK